MFLLCILCLRWPDVPLLSILPTVCLPTCPSFYSSSHFLFFFVFSFSFFSCSLPANPLFPGPPFPEFLLKTCKFHVSNYGLQRLVEGPQEWGAFPSPILLHLPWELPSFFPLPLARGKRTNLCCALAHMLDIGGSYIHPLLSLAFG